MPTEPDGSKWVAVRVPPLCKNGHCDYNCPLMNTDYEDGSECNAGWDGAGSIFESSPRPTPADGCPHAENPAPQPMVCVPREVWDAARAWWEAGTHGEAIDLVEAEAAMLQILKDHFDKEGDSNGN